MDLFHTQKMAAFCLPTPKYVQADLLDREDPNSMSSGLGHEADGDEQSNHSELGDDFQSHLRVLTSNPLTELFKDFLSL